MHKKYRCLVVDDEHLARTLLENFLSKFPGVECVATCKSPTEATIYLQGGNIDIMLLDIQMPTLTGIEFLQTLREKPVVVFTTAYPEYALEGYALDVIDYLLKPFAFDRFSQAMNKAMSQVDLKQKKSPTATPTAVEAKPVPNETPDCIMVKADHKYYRIRYNDLLYVEGLKAYVSFFMLRKRVVALESLKHLEEVLPGHRFLRVHKSYIINLDKVDTVESGQVEIAGKKVPVGKTYRSVLHKALGSSGREI